MHRDRLTQWDIAMLKTLVTNDEQRGHFTEQHSIEWINKMEERGYIVVDRSSRIDGAWDIGARRDVTIPHVP